MEVMGLRGRILISPLISTSSKIRESCAVGRLVPKGMGQGEHADRSAAESFSRPADTVDAHFGQSPSELFDILSAGPRPDAQYRDLKPDDAVSTVMT